MIGGKAAAQTRPTALGTLVQASTYGMTIPTIYGTTRAPLLVIWAQNLRKGSCHGKKGKGKKKKSPPTYVEQADFLIGSNLIEGVMRIWNNSTKNDLNSVVITTPTVPNNSLTSYTIPDSKFYFVVAVTALISQSGFFKDYGWTGSGLGQATPNAGGTGYVVGDTFSIQGTLGGDGAVGHVTGVTSGSVTGFYVVEGSAGSGYVDGDTATTTTLTGVGSGLTLDSLITGIPYQDTSEYALFNSVQHGPDLADASSHKFWPWLYKWQPSDGATVFFPNTSNILGVPVSVIPNWTGNYKIYYTQLRDKGVPLNRVCLAFEPVLGGGSEYGGFTGQQIKYPQYAGCGSSSIDLGSGPALPSLQPEVKATFARFAPGGDADFMDMAEDTLKSGILQYGAELGLIQRGVNLNDLPAAVDKLVACGFEPDNTPANNWLGFRQPIKKGQFMLSFVKWEWGSGTSGNPPTMTDGAGNVWTPIMTAPDTGADAGFWYAQAAADIAAGNQMTPLYGGNGFADHMRAAAWVMDPTIDTVAATSTNSGTSALASGSITVGGPCWIAAVLVNTSAFNNDGLLIPAHWTDLFPQIAQFDSTFGTLPTSQGATTRILWRYVAAAGTYSFNIPLHVLMQWSTAMIALSASQPSSIPKALGNIVDKASMDNVRAQCQANGLWGSVVMNSQKAASDWLKEFYQCANAAPVWSGFRLKSVARSEVSTVGNGTLFISPTSSGPVATLTESDLKGDSTNPPVVITREAQVDTNNIKQVQYFDRNSDYNPSTASEPLAGPIALFGPRKEDPITLPEIQDPLVARKILAIEVRRATLLRNSIELEIEARFFPLEAMDLILFDEPKLGINLLPVRLTKVEEQDDHSLKCEAEPFIYGCNDPSVSAATSASPYVPVLDDVPAAVNPPVILEPPLRMCRSGKQELWFVVSDSDTNYGGCVVHASVDGGSSYSPIGTIFGNGTTGYLTADWPAASDPDATDTLSVDLTESDGALESMSQAQEDSFATPCYVAPSITPTPSFKSATDVFGGIDPSGCVAYGLDLTADLNLLFGWGRGNLFGSFTPTAVWVNRSTDGIPIPSSGVMSFTEGFFADVPCVIGGFPCGCSIEGPTICPCYTKQARGADLYGGSVAGGGYSLEAMAVNISDGGPIESIQVPVADTTFTCSGPAETVTFQGSLLAGFQDTGGGSLTMFRIKPQTPGSLPLFMTVVSGLISGGTGIAVPGWTLQFSGTGMVVYTKVGSIVEPPGAGYELMAYANANLTAPNKFDLTAAPTPLRRAVFGQPQPGQGADHAIGTRFAFLDQWQTNVTPAGMLKIPEDPAWINKLVAFKFVPFNTFGNGFGDLSTAIEYDFTPLGPASTGGSAGSGTGSSGSPSQAAYTIISGGNITQPDATHIDVDATAVEFADGTVALYNPRTFSIPAPSEPTTYNINYFDPNELGDGGSPATRIIPSFCQISTSRNGVPGYVYIGAIIAEPGGGGVVSGGGGFPGTTVIEVNGQ